MKARIGLLALVAECFIAQIAGARIVTDVITRDMISGEIDDFGNLVFRGLKGTSSAVYSGCIAANESCIEMSQAINSTSAPGHCIVVEHCGDIDNVVYYYNTENTTNVRTTYLLTQSEPYQPEMLVYNSKYVVANKAYSSGVASQTFDNVKGGRKGNYAFMAVNSLTSSSAKGKMYLDRIEFRWRLPDVTVTPVLTTRSAPDGTDAYALRLNVSAQKATEFPSNWKEITISQGSYTIIYGDTECSVVSQNFEDIDGDYVIDLVNPRPDITEIEVKATVNLVFTISRTQYLSPNTPIAMTIPIDPIPFGDVAHAEADAERISLMGYDYLNSDGTYKPTMRVAADIPYVITTDASVPWSDAEYSHTEHDYTFDPATLTAHIADCVAGGCALDAARLDAAVSADNPFAAANISSDDFSDITSTLTLQCPFVYQTAPLMTAASTATQAAHAAITAAEEDAAAADAAELQYTTCAASLQSTVSASALYAAIERGTVTALTDARRPTPAYTIIGRTIHASDNHTPITIHDMAGRTLHQGILRRPITLPPGAYIITHQGRTQKLIL